jgi:hypothetical protein
MRKTVTVPAMDTPEVHLTDLTPATNYTLLVTAVFVSNRNMTSETFAFSTVGKEELPRKLGQKSMRYI